MQMQPLEDFDNKANCSQIEQLAPVVFTSCFYLSFHLKILGSSAMCVCKSKYQIKLLESVDLGTAVRNTFFASVLHTVYNSLGKS